jgi:hypothetical protein
VDPHLEVLAGVLVLVRRADHREPVLLGRQRDRTLDLGLGAHDRLDDLAVSRLVDHLVVVGLQSDSNLLLCHAGNDRPLVRGKGPKIGRHIAGSFRTTMHTADATGREHSNSNLMGDCEGTRHGSDADWPAPAKGDWQVA